MSSEQRFFDETFCQIATFADLDVEQVRAFLRGERVRLLDGYRAGLDEREQMQEFGWLQEDHPSYGALLCFGQRPSLQVAGAYIRCIYWRDTERLRGWIDDREYRGSLFEQLAQARDFLQKHLNFGRIIDHEGSYDQPEIPFRVLEEVLVNALVHREYVTEAGTPRTEVVVVELFSDRIEISSPGGPPEHMSLESLQKVQEKPLGSYLRNPQIAQIFYLKGHGEKLGVGLVYIQQIMQEAGLPPHVTLDQATQTFTVTLFRPAQPPAIPDREATSALALPHDTSQSGGSNILPVPGIPAQPPYVLLGQRFFWTLLSIVLIAGGLMVGTSVSDYYKHSPLPFSPASTTIKIASDFPTSGVDLTAGLPLQDGVQMAIDEANQKHLLPTGYTLKLVPYDDVGRNNQHNPLVGANNMRQAIADNLVAGIIGPFNSSVALAELPITNQAPIAQLSPSTTYSCLTESVTNDPDCTGNSNIQPQMRPTGWLTFFRLATTDNQQGKAAADYLFINTKHYHTVMLIHDSTDVYSFDLALSFQQEWQQLGGVVVSFDLPEQKTSVSDYQKALQSPNVASSQPDLIYFAGNNPNGTYVLQALSTIPTLKDVPFAAAGGFVDDTSLQAATLVHRSAPIYASLPIEDPAHSGTPVGTNFKDNYTASRYKYYQPHAASAYDCTMMLIQAIKLGLQQVSTPHGPLDHDGAVQFRKAVLQVLAHLSYTGATGHHSFDANGDTSNHTISFYQLDLSHAQPDWTWLQQVST